MFAKIYREWPSSQHLTVFAISLPIGSNKNGMVNMENINKLEERNYVCIQNKTYNLQYGKPVVQVVFLLPSETK